MHMYANKQNFSSEENLIIVKQKMLKENENAKNVFILYYIILSTHHVFVSSDYFILDLNHTAQHEMNTDSECVLGIK